MEKGKSSLAVKIIVMLLIISAAALTVLLNVSVMDKDIDAMLSRPASVQSSAEVEEIPKEIETVTPTEPPKEEEPEEILPQHIEVTAVPEYMTVGNTVQLSATVSPSDCDYSSLIWESSDESVASVDENGSITANAKGTAYITVRTDKGANAVLTVNIINKAVVYFSPSHQVWYKYSVGDTNESAQSRKIAEYCSAKLAEAGVETVICKNSVAVKERGKKAKKEKADCYVAIHTKTSEDRGASVLYNPNYSESTRLGLRIRDSIRASFGEENQATMASALDKNYSEVKYPKEYSIPAVIVEADSHASKAGAQWIIDNAEAIGHSIADGILYYFLTDITA